MGELTCPNCNVDIDPEELRRNGLCCPTCGHDMSDIEDLEELGFDDEEELDEELNDEELDEELDEEDGREDDDRRG